MEIILPIYAMNLGDSPSYMDVNIDKMWVVLTLWILLPFAFITALFAEIFLIPIFVAGVSTFWGFALYGLSLYVFSLS